jgi:hypothetical protein
MRCARGTDCSVVAGRKIGEIHRRARSGNDMDETTLEAGKVAGDMEVSPVAPEKKAPPKCRSWRKYSSSCARRVGEEHAGIC